MPNVEKIVFFLNDYINKLHYHFTFIILIILSFDYSTACSCSQSGSVNEFCDSQGVCTCLPNVQGTKCDACISEYYGLYTSENFSDKKLFLLYF